MAANNPSMYDVTSVGEGGGGVGGRVSGGRTLADSSGSAGLSPPDSASLQNLVTPWHGGLGGGWREEGGSVCLR
jgi:hypothetical protein